MTLAERLRIALMQHDYLNEGECDVLIPRIEQAIKDSTPRAGEEIVRVLRLVQYEGPRAQVEKQLENSIHGTRFGYGAKPSERVKITAVTLDQFPQVMREGTETPDPRYLAELQAEVDNIRSGE